MILELLKNILKIVSSSNTNVYDRIKQKHPDIQIGNSFALHQVINKNLKHIVTDLALGDFVGPINQLIM